MSDGTIVNEAHWNFFLPCGEAASLLILGAGEGDTCCRMAEHAGRVDALCFSEEQVRTVKERACVAELDNLQIRTHVPGERFELADGTVDAVIVERLMNYPASYAGRTAPEQAALRLLKEAHRVLVPDGVFVMGGQNLLHHVLGLGRVIDSLRKSSPRTDAGLDADLAALGSDRRTFRQTLNGYRQLIQAAGFGSVRAFAPLPDGVDPHAVVSLDAPGPQQFLFRQRTRRHSTQTQVAASLGEFAAATGLLPRVAPFYYLVASK